MTAIRARAPMDRTPRGICASRTLEGQLGHSTGVTRGNVSQEGLWGSPALKTLALGREDCL